MFPPQPPWQSSRRLLQRGSSGGSDDVSGMGGVGDPNANRIPGIPPADPPSGVNSDVVVILAALLCALICVIGLAAVARCARSRRDRAAAGADIGHASLTSSSVAEAGLFGGGGVGHHGAGAAGLNMTPPPPPLTTATITTSTTTAKGLKKKALKSLPKLAYADAVAAAAAARGAAPEGEEGRAEEVLSECVICLSEFGEREEVRVMPQCGHGFHVACVDTWLRSNSSCPSCRRPIVLDEPSPPNRCRRCETGRLQAVIASSSAGAAAGSSGRGGRSRGGGGFLP